MDDIDLVNLTPEPFAFLTRECDMAAISTTVAEIFEKLGAALAQAKAAPSGPPMARYRRLQGGRVTINLGFPVRSDALARLRASGLETGLTSGGLAMRGVHVGSFDTLRQTYDALLAAISKAGRAPADEMWERYYGAPGEADARTEVLWPVKPALASYE